MDARLKAKYKYHHGRAAASAALQAQTDDKKASKMQGLSREARSNQRRLLTAFGKCFFLSTYIVSGQYLRRACKDYQERRASTRVDF